MVRQELRREARRYLAASAATAVFSAVYEYFGRGVNSPAMILAFLIPLIPGALGLFLLSFIPAFSGLSYGRTREHTPFLSGEALSRLGTNLYATGLAFFTVGSLFQGALTIYGTTNRLLSVYLFGGAAFALTGAASVLAALITGPSETDGFKDSSERDNGSRP